MKEPYRWKYNIKVRTKDGDFVYEDEVLERLEELLNKHPDYEGVEAQHIKKLLKVNNGRRNKNTNK